MLLGRVCRAHLTGAQPLVGAVAAAEVSGEESEHRARSVPNIVSYACLQAIYTAPIDSLQPVIIFVDFFFLHALFVFTLRKRNNISQCRSDAEEAGVLPAALWAVAAHPLHSDGARESCL